MNRWLILAEGPSAGLFEPLDLMRPGFLLRNGAWTVAERWIALLAPSMTIAAVRPMLAATVHEETGWLVNELPQGPIPDEVWLSAGVASCVEDHRWRDLSFPGEFEWVDGPHRLARLSQATWIGMRERLAAWVNRGAEVEPPPLGLTEDATLPLRGARGLWDLVDRLNQQLSFDWNHLTTRNSSGSRAASDHDHGVTVIAPHSVWLGDEARIDPQVVINAESGPVWIDDGAVIESFTRIDGPAYVGKGSVLLGGKFTGGCAIGPGCKIGGEWEASIAQGFANKAHAGFFGHGFLGEWVNLGAMTTNSDLKNNYNSVRVQRRGAAVDTGFIKVGSYVADHTKTGIGTLLPTGAAWGVGVNYYAGGLGPKTIPSYVWAGQDSCVEHRLDKMTATARTAVGRRAALLRRLGRPDMLTEAQADLLHAVFERTAAERSSFLSGRGKHSHQQE